jgi:hypothetical protein
MAKQYLQNAEEKPDRLLLYVDQWEELYAQALSSSDKEKATGPASDVSRFIDLLLTATRIAPVTIVGTVRADFYDPLIGHEGIRALLPTRQVLLARMSRSELESTIVGPAGKVGLVFDPPTLVERILDEAGEDEGMLPLLQYALKESWALRKDHIITADSYARSGGVREAIRNTAERTFAALSPDGQTAARQLFLRLVMPGEGQEDTRALAAMPSEPMQRRIVDQFAGPRTRLLVTGSDRAARPTVEVAHEALNLAASAGVDRCQPGKAAHADGGATGKSGMGATRRARGFAAACGLSVGTGARLAGRAWRYHRRRYP